MKLLNRGLALAVVGAGLAALPTSGVQAAAAPQADENGVAAMKAAASGRALVSANSATGRVGFVRLAGEGDLSPAAQAEDRAGAVAKASSYLDRYASNFGARAAELEQSEVVADKTGWTVTFEQSYRGVPVFAAELKAHVDREGDLTSVNGFAVPGLNLSTTPELSKAEASARALQAVKSKPSGYEDGLPAGFAKGLTVRSADLNVYRMGTTRGIAGESRLAWVVEVWNKSTVRETVILDATTGKPLNRWSMIAHALDRELYEGAYDPDNLVWQEGEEFPGDLNQDQQNEIRGAGETYWLFKNTFGYNSWDGNSGKMITVNNDPTISCPNANWNGVTTNYCNGVTGDDTVAHEWGHAYTESTSGLIYQWQAGAMNEAYSDIWGETVDMLNDRHNEQGEPNSEGGTVYRTPGRCSDYTRSDITMNITAPQTVAGPCNAAPASFGPVFGQAPVNGTAVVGIDGVGTLSDGTPDTSTTNGCLPFTNQADIAGKWVFVDRGACTFGAKADNAEAAGAVGIVVGNNRAGDPISMSGDANIYGVMVSQTDGDRFKAANGPVSFTIQAVAAETDVTHRWLSGETDPAFGGAIRDMWNPNCYGDPGKVSDAQYHCDESDAGGVHSNSGVVNRTFAILVDGIDGQGTSGIGLDKAAWLFWHSQYNYLTPSSYFPDLADSLEASCEELKGVTFERVTLGSPEDPDGSDGGVVEPAVVEGGTTEADCDKVTAAIAETELRLDPAEQCNFQPMLEQGAPVLNCGNGTTTKAAFSENFEDGLAGWTQDEEMVYADTETIPWQPEDDAPADRAGTVAYAPDPQGGACNGGPDDITSRSGLISPAITMPGGSSPRLSFDHYVATEAHYDGGNVKYSVGGGEFQLIPDAKYVFNAPKGELDAGSGPMGEEPAWTGTDGGQLGGSWGTTVVNLSGLANPGQSIRFRFDMGRDGCGGLDGWYVDNVAVEACEPVTTPSPSPSPTPTPTPTPTPAPQPVPSTTVAKVSPKLPDFNRDFTVIGKVTAEGLALAPRSIVIFKIDGERVGSRRLDDGRAVMTVRRNYGAGKHKLLVIYRGSDRVLGSRDTHTFTIQKR